MNEKNELLKKSYVKEFLPYFIIILVVVFVKMFVVSPIRVNGASMNPTLNDKDIMILNEISYGFSDIVRFDIVVVKEENEYLIKRIIGLPGEKIEYKDNKLYIDGKYVKEDFKHMETMDFSTTLGEDEYFIMGDNRTNSTDSRIFGPISRDEIIGKTSLTILPISRFGNKR
ncbi:MAG: signal peptidase I [bacterium]|nr:signal peptidase I [Mycoplasmatota bacterium]MDD6757830.1 signal peptidase I [bacterium]MDY2907642.1 signal peptidase I [Candidatus Faecimonas sp.]